MATASHKHSGGSIVQGGGADRPPQGTFRSQNPAPEQLQQQLGEAVAAACLDNKILLKWITKCSFQP